MKKLAYITFGSSLLLALLLGCTSTGTDLGSDDAAVERNIMDRLYQDPLTAQQNFGVRVSQGAATVYGTVRDGQVRARALSIVTSTPGVVDVRDNLMP